MSEVTARLKAWAKAYSRMAQYVLPRRDFAKIVKSMSKCQADLDAYALEQDALSKDLAACAAEFTRKSKEAYAARNKAGIASANISKLLGN